MAKDKSHPQTDDHCLVLGVPQADEYCLALGALFLFIEHSFVNIAIFL